MRDDITAAVGWLGAAACAKSVRWAPLVRLAWGPSSFVAAAPLAPLKHSAHCDPTLSHTNPLGNSMPRTPQRPWALCLREAPRRLLRLTVPPPAAKGLLGLLRLPEPRAPCACTFACAGTPPWVTALLERRTKWGLRFFSRLAGSSSGAPTAFKHYSDRSLGSSPHTPHRLSAAHHTPHRGARRSPHTACLRSCLRAIQPLVLRPPRASTDPHSTSHSLRPTKWPGLLARRGCSPQE